MKAKLVIITARKRGLRAHDRRLLDRLAVLALLLGEFDDQDAVLGRERDQHHDADLGIKVERQAGDDSEAMESRARRPDREQHRHRDGPALVEPTRNRKAKSTARPRMMLVCPEAACSW